MIFPGNIYNTKIEPNLNPSWVLAAVNVTVFIFIIFSFADGVKNYKTDSYQNKVSKISEIYKQTVDPLELDTFNEQSPQVMIRDSKFWARAQHFPFKGDQVKIKETKDFLAELRTDYSTSPQYIFGLAPTATSSWAWITYQFLHTGFFHLLVNVLFLFLVVQVLQKHVDHSWVYAVYILSGIGGGFAYLWMNQYNEIAVLGASGAICGLIAFLSVVLNIKNIEWSYFLSPISGYYGIIYLPAYLLFPIYLISDFTTVLYYNSGVQSSVAHSAHIGGTLAGFSLGLVYLFDLKAKRQILKKWGKELPPDEYSELRDRVG